MIDIHCHILPGVDDGAKDIEDSLEMARIAQSEGIKTIINTSHYNRNFDYIMGKDLCDSLNQFNDLLKEHNIDVEVLIGNELYYNDDLLEDLKNDNFYTLNRSKYLLIEFSPTNFPKNLNDIVYEFKIKGYVPILAHVERYRDVQEDINIIKEAINEGALIQINASSILGKGPKGVDDTCNELIRRNWVHFVGTDAHSSNRRRPLMRDAYEHVANKYGDNMANRLFIDNSKCVINNEDILLVNEVIEVKKPGFFSKLFKRKK